jgi:hypothetical protein
MKNVEDIVKDLQKVRLSEVERAEMRMALDAHIRSKPLSLGVPSPLFHAEFFFRRHLMAMSFATLLLVSSGSALFAEQSLPGDVLYGLKRGVNEEVRGWFIDSPEDRALWQLSLAERRLSEIESLSEQNKLSDEVQTELSAEVDEYTQSALEEDPQDTMVTESFIMTTAEDVSNNTEASLMKTSLMVVDSEEGEVVVEPVLSSITEEDINRLGEQIKEEQKHIEENRPKNGQRPFIQAKGRLIIAEKMLFESRQALKLGNTDLAEELFLQSESSFSLVVPPSEEVLGEESAMEEAPVEEIIDEESNSSAEVREVPGQLKKKDNL